MGTKARCISKMMVVCLIGFALGLSLNTATAGATFPEIAPMPVYRIPFGIELEEVKRSVQQLEYHYQQIQLIKRMIEAGNWAGLGRLIGDPQLTGLIDQLELTLKATKKAINDFKHLHPSYEPIDASSAADYARKLADQSKIAIAGRMRILEIMTERYADSVVDENGNLIEYRRSNSMPAYIAYATEGNLNLGNELARLNEDPEGGLMRALQLNTQVELMSHAALLKILQTLSDQNRLLSLVVGASAFVD